MSQFLQTTKGNVNLVSAYALTLGPYPDVKGSFYEVLADTVRLMNIDEQLFILDISTHVSEISGVTGLGIGK